MYLKNLTILTIINPDLINRKFCYFILDCMMSFVLYEPILIINTQNALK